MAAANHICSMACGCGPPPELCLEDSEIVTQLCERDGSFRTAPRGHVPELGMSVQRGRLTVAQALELVTKRAVTPEKIAESRVRYATVASLRNANFAVIHTPGKIRDGVHCTITWPSEHAFDPTVPWPIPVSEALDICFNDLDTGDEVNE